MSELAKKRGKEYMDDRRKMQINDWLIWFALLIVGVALGLAVFALVGIEEPAFLQSIIFYFIPIGFVFVFTFFILELGGASPSNAVNSLPTKDTKKHKPLFLLVSLPVGFTIGVIEAVFGLSGAIL